MTFLAILDPKFPQGLDFGSEHNRDRWRMYVEDNRGKRVKVEILRKPVSHELRGYYFNALLPAVRSTCDEWNGNSDDEMHEIIKKMLFYFEAYNPVTGRKERFGRSVLKNDDFNNMEKAMGFINIICDYLLQCGREIPDPEEYKRFINSAPTR